MSKNLQGSSHRLKAVGFRLLQLEGFIFMKPSKLDKITVRGFKSIRELVDFELRNINVIVGANGAGKSNFLEIFEILSAMMKPEGLSEYVAGAADAYFFGGPKLTRKIEIQLRLGKNGYDFNFIPSENGDLFITKEQRHFNNGYWNFTRDFPAPSYDAQLPNELSSKATEYTYNSIKNWKIYHFHDTSKFAPMRRECDVNHGDILAADAGNIAAFLYRLKSEFPAEYNKIVNAVQLVVPFFYDFILKPNFNEMIRLNWQQVGLNDYPMRPSQLSDGSMRFICLATALLQPQPPATIIIDEPELGLHPEAIGILAELIKLASAHTQVILATQSPLLLDQFSIEDIIVAKRKNGASTFARLNEQDYTAWLEDYSVGELWIKNVIQGGSANE